MAQYLAKHRVPVGGQPLSECLSFGSHESASWFEKVSHVEVIAEQSEFGMPGRMVCDREKQLLILHPVRAKASRACRGMQERFGPFGSRQQFETRHRSILQSVVEVARSGPANDLVVSQSKACRPAGHQVRHARCVGPATRAAPGPIRQSAGLTGCFDERMEFRHHVRLLNRKFSRRCCDPEEPGI